MMGTQRKADVDHHRQHNQHQHGVIQSSIALLQERFKQLQRVREMREKKELLRIFSHHNNNNNANINNTASTTTTVLSTSTTTTATISTNTNNFNSSNNIPSRTDHSAMQYNYEPYSHDRLHDDGDLDKELQVFLPPNYYNYKPSCYSQSSPSSPSPSSSSSSSSDNSNEVSLSLWPSTPPCNVTPTAATAGHFQRTTSFLRPTMEMSGRPCMSRGLGLEDSHHVSDVDTTLHL